MTILKRAAIFFLPLLIGCRLASAQPAPPIFQLPVDCEVGQSCVIQKLLDHDPGTGRQDYRCGTLTTDGHDGVDIRLRTMEDMHRGYGVIAAASGQVLRVRDGEPDISSRQRTDLAGKDAGNGVVIDHGNGWQTQYSHLRHGSVSVRPGQAVAAGTQLGLVGMSGNAEFPHLHFTVRHQEKTVDPFTGEEPPAKCSLTHPAVGLWAAATTRSLNYTPTAVIVSGIASSVPPKSVADRPTPTALAGPQDPLLMWIDMIGAQDGDVQTFRISDPFGQVVHVQETRVVGGGLSWFAYSGKRAPASGWPVGRYVGRYTLRRSGAVLVQTEAIGVVR